MALLKENIITLLKLFVFSCSLNLFLMCFGKKLSLLLHVWLIQFYLLIFHVFLLLKSCIGMPLTIYSLEFLVVLVSFCPFVEHNKFSSRSVICVFLGYDEGRKAYHCFDPITQKLYMSHHIVFLNHISFLSIPSTTHSLTRSYLIHIVFFMRILIVYHL